MNFNNISTKKIIVCSISVLLGLSSSLHAQRIAAGGWHSLVICNDSTVKAFGENASGQLGDGTTTDQNLPVNVTGLTGIIAVSGGGDQLEAHSMALKSDGTVWCWGSNLYGGLGNGSTTNSLMPVQAVTLTNMVDVSAGGWHSAALKNDGTVWTWGWNTDGQLGDGSTTDRTIPGVVPGLNNVVAIEAGIYHVLALKSDSTVWAWGDNVSGQIGDGSTIDRTSPVQVAGLSQVVKISAGRFFSLAVKSDGTVWTWGENLYGQLGNGSNVDSPIPLQVTGLSGITSAIVATGAFHCMVEKNDNTVWAWGRNTYGNLGNNTVAHSSVPVQMQGMSDVGGLAAGTNFSLLFKDDGTFWGCGRNASGQLGDGAVIQKNIMTQSTPVCPINVVVPNGLHDLSSAALSTLSVAPNPSEHGIFNIRFANSLPVSARCEIAIYDMVGRKIKQCELDLYKMNSAFPIDLSNQKDGIYMMRISSNGQQMSQKLLKQ